MEKREGREGGEFLSFGLCRVCVCVQKEKRLSVQICSTARLIPLCTYESERRGGGLGGSRWRGREGVRALMCTGGSQKLVCI